MESMNIDDIIQNREELNTRLRMALATMERKSTIQEIRKEIIHNQQQCPHFSDKYNWAIVDGVCPYCGYMLGGDKTDARDNFI